MINLKKIQVTIRTNFSHAKAAFWQIRGLGFLLNLYSARMIIDLLNISQLIRERSKVDFFMGNVPFGGLDK